MLGTALAQAPTSGAPAAGGGLNSILGFLPIILIFAVLYFLMIMPQQRRQKKHAQMLEQIKRGDRVVLGSGIHGIVANVREHTFLVKVAEST
ncbi:preprotein translocase subunit YajC, partial [candidate division WOR-3 bacterium]|nr:preprotein translocase subunit YajC [candidate division WOR-3 bacterium]